ncbi:MAG: hypothetical protein ACOCX0_07165, partial [Bacteroidota bacterium]
MKKSIILIITALITLLFASCRSSKPVTSHYYIIEIPAQLTEPDTVAPLPYNLELTDVDVHPAY